MNSKWIAGSGVLVVAMTASAGQTAPVQAPVGRDADGAPRWTLEPPAASPPPALVAARSEASARPRREGLDRPFATEAPQPAASAVPGDGDGDGGRVAVWVLAVLSGGVLLDWIRRGWPR